MFQDSFSFQSLGSSICLISPCFIQCVFSQSVHPGHVFLLPGLQDHLIGAETDDARVHPGVNAAGVSSQPVREREKSWIRFSMIFYVGQVEGSKVWLSLR